ncbi:MAG: 4-(cytidine 5'-diphospho)-2-C-methyl-D-erythritol kinase [Oscillospiraceae bacterium]|nr:4-(cytidine 5'-diphospho)-2-C-methyl-D-erythritol kinase [Oscillospiraceae bacterium]
MKNTEQAWAKLNLCLEVTGKLPDGYHAVRGIMQSTDFHDDVTLEEGDGPWTVRSDLCYLPTGDTNLAARAAILFREKTGLGPVGGLITLRKRIPVCGGYGGGSSDAAAVLRLLNRLSGYPLSWEELEEMSLPLGADVPFCIRGGTVLAEGKGEKLTPLPDLSGVSLILCRPDFSCSTPLLFQAVDRLKLRVRPDVGGMCRAVEEGDVPGVARRLFNIFEEVLPKKQRDTVREIRSALLDAGALGAAMTGTGSGIFGIFPSPEAAGRARETLTGQGIACDTAATTARLV